MLGLIITSKLNWLFIINNEAVYCKPKAGITVQSIWAKCV